MGHINWQPSQALYIRGLASVIAGPAFRESARALGDAGGTSFGMRTLVEMASNVT
jgi:hypothetical protein